MTKTIAYMGVKHANMDAYMTYLENKNINEAICQKPRKNYVYEINMHNIYNIILDQTNKKLQDKAASEATLQAAKTGRDPIRYLVIPKKLWLSNQSEHHPIPFICLATRQLYNTMHHTNNNTTD